MDSETLAQLLIKEKSSDVDQQLPAEVQAIRERFPLNAMVPLVKRAEGKPSERVRIRNMFKQMQDEGFAVSAHGKPCADPKLLVHENFEQSGKAWALRVRLTARYTPESGSLELLRTVQERLHEISIPILGTDSGLELVECTEESLAWDELGMDGPWEGFDIKQAIVWLKAVGNDRWGANNWREAGFTAQETAAWVEAGLYYSDGVDRWRSALGDAATPQLVGKFTCASISPEQAAASRDIWAEES